MTKKKSKTTPKIQPIETPWEDRPVTNLALTNILKIHLSVQTFQVEDAITNIFENSRLACLKTLEESFITLVKNEADWWWYSKPYGFWEKFFRTKSYKSKVARVKEKNDEVQSLLDLIHNSKKTKEEPTCPSTIISAPEEKESSPILSSV